MRTSLGDHLVVLRRPAALAALAAAAGGAIGVYAPRLGLWTLTARVQALDTTGESAVTTMPGAQASPATWLAMSAGVVIIAVALLVALDRPPRRALRLLVASAAVLLLVTMAALLQRPEPAAFAADPRSGGLVAGVALPLGVGIELLVHPAIGMWVLAASGLLVAAGAIVADRRG